MSDRQIGPEAAKSYRRRQKSGFFDKYLSGSAILDIGYRGQYADAEPITEAAIGVELDYPGYDGVTLPFPDLSQDSVFVSHCLEHIVDYRMNLREWYRVLKYGGFLIIAVPHQYLYERKVNLPSIFNDDHKRFYTPASLLREIEESLPLDGYRVRSLSDIDEGFDYSTPPEQHAVGSYEIELVLEKIPRPHYGEKLRWGELERLSAERYALILNEMSRASRDGRLVDCDALRRMICNEIPPNYYLVSKHIDKDTDIEFYRFTIRDIMSKLRFDARAYLDRYKDISRVFGDNLELARDHFIRQGYFENRVGFWRN